MSKQRKSSFGSKAIQKSIRNNPFKAGVAASLLAMSAFGALVGNARVRGRARELKRSVQGRLARGKEDVGQLIENRTESHA